MICNGVSKMSFHGFPLAFYRLFVYRLLYVTYDATNDEHVFKYEWTRYLWKPLIGCLPCMSSIYGIILYLIFQDINLTTVVELPLIVIGSAGINRML